MSNSPSFSSAPDLSALSLDDLRRELERREKAVAQLQARRERIVQELAALDAELAAAGMSAARDTSATSPDTGTSRRARSVLPRPQNTLNLMDALTAAIEPGRIITPPEAAAIVKKDGYITHSKTFHQTVTVALSKHPRFRRVGRGQYECLATAQEAPQKNAD